MTTGGTDFDGSFLFVMDTDDADDGDAVYLSVEIVDGECMEARQVDGPGRWTGGSHT